MCTSPATVTDEAKPAEPATSTRISLGRPANLPWRKTNVFPASTTSCRTRYVFKMFFNFLFCGDPVAQQVVPDHVYGRDLERNAFGHGDREVSVGRNLNHAGIAKHPGGSLRPKEVSAPRVDNNALNPCLILLANSCSRPYTSTQLNGCSAGSASSSTSQPPGFKALTMFWNARCRSGMCTSTSRACIRSNDSSVAGSCAMSWVRTWTLWDVASFAQEASISVANTLPVSPMRSAVFRTRVGHPAPTSQHRQPLAMPQASNCRSEAGSNNADNKPRRCAASFFLFSRRW